MPSRERVLMPCNGGVCREGFACSERRAVADGGACCDQSAGGTTGGVFAGVASRLGEGTPSTPAVEIAVGAALERTAVSLSDDGGMR